MLQSTQSWGIGKGPQSLQRDMHRLSDGEEEKKPHITPESEIRTEDTHRQPYLVSLGTSSVKNVRPRHRAYMNC